MPAVVGAVGVLDLDLAAAPREAATRRAGRGEEADLVDGEGALDEHGCA